VDPKAINKIMASESGHNTIFDLQIDGAKSKAMVIDWQFDPLKDRLLHIDMKRIAMDQKMRVTVPVKLTGIAYGVKNDGGIMDQTLREVEIECLPSDIPSSIDIDVTELKFGDVLRVSDLAHEAKWKFLTGEDVAVCHVTSIKEAVEPTAADAAAAPTTAEPEVIKKGKQETEEAAAPAEKKK
jgi:large subunit ribosomal protein L25